MASKLTAAQGLEILYFDTMNWDGTDKTTDMALNSYMQWCDDVSYKCENVLIPYSFLVFDPSEYEEGMGSIYKNGWVEMLLTCSDSECTRNSGSLINVPLPDNKEDYDTCLSVLGEDPKEFHNLGTRFLKAVK